MAEHKKADLKNKSDKADNRQTLKNKSPHVFAPLAEVLAAWDQLPITKTSFQPFLQRHAEILSGASSPEQATGFIRRLQETYGNHYVQRLLESSLYKSAVIGQDHSPQYEGISKEVIQKSAIQSEISEDVPLSEKPLINAVPSADILRSPDGEPVEGTITIEPVNTEYYEVTGTNLEEVAKQLDKREFGRCTWEWTQNYTTDAKNRTDRVDIGLNLTIRLPRWTEGMNKASAPAKKEWRRMLAGLNDHENGHADIARDWAPNMQERLLGKKKSKIKALWKKAKAAHERLQKSYDKKTKHGKTQGASLDTGIE